MKAYKSIMAVALSGTLACSYVLPVYAAEDTNTGKEEVIYIGTNAEGEVSDINVVNIWAGGDVKDYGDYTSVKMLTTTDPITQDGDMVTFSSDASEVYYQGTMDASTQIPWKIQITYKLDGETIAPEDLGGRSGHLEIDFSVTKNTACKGTFYDDYALQATFALDTKNCKNIVAADATMANVGSNKQLSYTMLPGKGIQTVMQADVTDFTMDAVSINGIQMNLDVDIDDKELMEKVEEIMDAAEQLNKGAGTLQDGSNRLKTGGLSVKDGASELADGAASLDQGISDLQTGVSNLQTGLDTLNKKSDTLTSGSSQFLTALTTLQTELSKMSVTTEQLTELTKTSGEIKTGIGNLYSGATELQKNLGYAQYKAAVKSASGGELDIDSLLAGNAQTIESLKSQITPLQQNVQAIKQMDGYSQSAELQTQAAQLEGQISSLSQVIALLNGNTAAIGGVDTYLSSLSEGVDTLVFGLKELNANYKKFDAAIGQLAKNLSSMAGNMTKLSTAVNSLVKEYKKLDKGITEYTGGVATIVAGYKQVVTGVSTLATGSSKLVTGVNSLKKGTSDLYDGIEELYDGSSELQDGTSEFNEKTSDMDTQVQDQIDEMLASVSGGDKEVVSFASSKNTNIDSVQFVIKTTSIKKTEETVIETKTETKRTFWQKVKDLF